MLKNVFIFVKYTEKTNATIGIIIFKYVQLLQSPIARGKGVGLRPPDGSHNDGRKGKYPKDKCNEMRNVFLRA